MFPSDFVRAPNLADHPTVYRLENEALARDGRLDAALERLAPYAGRDLLDVGSGNGFWLDRYAAAGARVVGVEPDPEARARYDGDQRLLAGSAEHLPLDDASVDIVHARFAYFFGPGADRGLAEVARVLRAGGVFLAIDNSWRGGDFADLLRDATTGNATMDPEATDAWWKSRGATRQDVVGGWSATSPEELASILRIEFPGSTVDRFLAAHPDKASLSYHFAVFAWRPDSP